MPLIWAMTTGEAGMRAQAMGLAEAVGGTIVEKIIHLRAPWTLFPGHLCPFPMMGLAPDSDPIEPPWPDLLITCGRRSTAVSIAIRKATAGKTRTVHIQNPKCPPRYFDLVIAMRHDDFIGDNVFIVDTALNPVRPERIEDGRARWESAFAALPRPLVGVLLGGRTRTQRFADDDAERLVKSMLALHDDRGAGVVVSPSRRTEPSAQQIIREGLGDNEWARIWDGAGDNPYFGMLALCDAFVVTNDSVSMMSEAMATGKPVAIFPLTGHGRPQEKFIAALRLRGHALPVFEGQMPVASGPAVGNATTAAAARVRQMMAA
jgi:mitochondrial fission protein ELM1